MGVFTQVASNIKEFARKFACKSAYASCVNGAQDSFLFKPLHHRCDIPEIEQVRELPRGLRADRRPCCGLVTSARFLCLVAESSVGAARDAGGRRRAERRRRDEERHGNQGQGRKGHSLVLHCIFP